MRSMDQNVERAEKATPNSPETIEAALSLNHAGQAKKRRWPWIAALAVVAGAGIGLWQWGAATPAQITYRTAEVKPGLLTVEVSATGTLQPLTQVEVSSELSGVVRSVSVEENQRVARGDVLAELDTTRISAQIDRAEANVEAAQARVTDAQVTAKETDQTLTRIRMLSGRGQATAQALETAEAAADRASSAVAIAAANVAVAKAELALQQADLAKSTILAPIDGIVLSRAVNPGQTVASSMQAPILFVIAENLETMELKAAVDEADIGTVASGQNARFTVDAFPERRFDAVIRDVSYASIVTEGVVTYEARLNVDNEELLLRPGMTATVDIVTREEDGVLLVPASAFRFSPQVEAPGSSWSLQSLFMPRRLMSGGRRPAASSRSEGRPLYVLRNGEPQAVRVVTGATDGTSIEVISGLSQGDQVILGVQQDQGRAGGRR